MRRGNYGKNQLQWSPKMNNIFEIKNCEVCGNDNLTTVLNLGSHPLCDDLVPVGDDRICREYPIEILFCANCVTAHQRFQIPKKELFKATYHYRARFTADVLNGMQSLVDVCEKHINGLHNKKILDIGCNDGSLLDFFKAKGSITIGVEPTDAYLDAKENGHHVYNDFLSIALAETILKTHGKPDIITFTNVFAHIENLREVIEALKILKSRDLVIVIENHYLGSVLDRNQFDTFYHEHPRSYSYSSFIQIAKSIDMTLQKVEFPSRYGGNIRVMMGANHFEFPVQHEEIILEEKNYLNKFTIMRTNIDKWTEKKGQLIKSLKEKNEKLIGKAFPGRAAILIKMLGIDEAVISAVFEKPGSMKIGHYIPGTRIPILSDDVLFTDIRKNSSIMNFAWHIASEIKSYLLMNGMNGKVIDVLAAEDF